MIYILVGNDTKKKSAYLKKISGKCDVIKLSKEEISEEILCEFAGNQSLFGDLPVITFENIISDENISLSKEGLILMQDSKTIFIFLEDKILAANEKKYSKYCTIEKFEEKKTSPTSKINTFAIADAFGRGDKIRTWILYREAIENGTEPEAITGILFWKVKTMMLSGSRLFNIDKLKSQSSQIVSLYHKAHRGECDFTIGLEQFILNTLSK